MPKLPDQWIVAEATDGTEFKATVKCSVLVDGLFSIEVPDELTKLVFEDEKRSLKVCSVTKRLYCSELKRGLDYLRSKAKDLIEVERTIERVIIYNCESGCAFWLDDKGKIFPNGESQSSGQWWRGKMNHDFGTHHESRSVYSVGIGAAVYDKSTFVRSSGTTCTYDRVRSEEGTVIHQLNSFVHLSIDPDILAVRQIPYTDEAARFFLNTMIGICRLAQLVDSFIGDDRRLQEAIENQTKLLR